MLVNPLRNTIFPMNLDRDIQAHGILDFKPRPACESILFTQKGMEQVARLYHLDVMALISYDQVAHADDTKSSILYWTIVGAYFVKGSKNDVQTFVDTAIFDVKSNKLLFRAPGINRIEATSTLVNSTEEMRKARENSFSLAMSDMTNNLNAELDKFKERIKKDKSVTVSYRPGYGGGGAFGPQMIIILTVFFLVKRLFIQKKMESS